MALPESRRLVVDDAMHHTRRNTTYGGYSTHFCNEREVDVGGLTASVRITGSGERVQACRFAASTSAHGPSFLRWLLQLWPSLARVLP